MEYRLKIYDGFNKNIQTFTAMFDTIESVRFFKMLKEPTQQENIILGQYMLNLPTNIKTIPIIPNAKVVEIYNNNIMLKRGTLRSDMRTPIQSIDFLIFVEESNNPPIQIGQTGLTITES